MKMHPILSSAASAIAAVILVVPSARAQGSNFCGAPQVISGVGAFAFDNTAATLDGPGSCANDDKNVWFHWQPPYGGIAFVSTCGQTNVHTIVNVYQYTGTGCPAGGTVYCSFVGCGPGAPQG